MYGLPLYGRCSRFFPCCICNPCFTEHLLILAASPSSSEFERISEGLADALDFSTTIGFTAGQGTSSYERGGGLGVLGEVDFYTRCLSI